MLFQEAAQSNFSERMRSSFSEVFGEVFPKLLLALAIVAVGYIVSKVMERIVEGVLRKRAPAPGARILRRLRAGGIAGQAVGLDCCQR